MLVMLTGFDMLMAQLAIVGISLRFICSECSCCFALSFTAHGRSDTASFVAGA